jgi:hypothetical protein
MSSLQFNQQSSKKFMLTTFAAVGTLHHRGHLEPTRRRRPRFHREKIMLKAR